MNDLGIRAATPDDLDTVLAFWKVAAEGTSISDDRNGVERLVARDPEALILAEHDGELVGTVIMRLRRLAVPSLPARGAPRTAAPRHRLGAPRRRRGSFRTAGRASRGRDGAPAERDRAARVAGRRVRARGALAPLGEAAHRLGPPPHENPLPILYYWWIIRSSNERCERPPMGEPPSTRHRAIPPPLADHGTEVTR